MKFKILLMGLILLCVFILYSPLEYLFHAGPADYKIWYPNFYLGVILLKYIPGSLLALFLSLRLKSIFKMPKKYALATFLLLFLLLSVFVGNTYFKFCYLLFFISGVLTYIHYKTSRFPNNRPSYSFIGNFFIVIAYTVLCLIFDRMHPFAKYDMFNAFDQKTFVFSFKNEEGEIVPINCIGDYTSNEILQIYNQLCRTHNINKNDSIHEQYLNNEMHSILVNKSNPNTKYKEVYLYRSDFTIMDNKIMKNEVKVAKIF